MKKKTFMVLLHMMVFYFASAFVTGIKSPSGPAGLIITGFLYGLVMMALPEVLKFFKFPDNFWARILMGTLFTLGLFALVNYLPGNSKVISFGAGYLGMKNFILFTLPAILTMTGEFVVMLVSAIFINLCSIIVDKLSE